MANNIFKCSILSDSRKMQIYSTSKFHFTPVRMAFINKINDKKKKKKCWQVCGERGILVGGENIKQCSHYRNQ